jgi:hypothetical protein
METINKDDLLPILQKSILANELVDEDNDEIVVPKKYIITNFRTIVKYELIINNDDEFRKTLDKLRYWMTTELPYEIFDYTYKNRHSVSIIIKDFRDFFYKELMTLVSVDDAKNINPIVKIGNISLLQYALARGFRWDNDTCANAAKSGNMECLKLLRVDGCPWGHHTMRNAARYGNLECLKYACETKCPVMTAYDDTYRLLTPCEMAYKYKKFDCMKYIYNKGCPCYGKTYNTVSYDQLVEYLHQHPHASKKKWYPHI